MGHAPGGSANVGAAYKSHVRPSRTSNLQRSYAESPEPCVGASWVGHGLEEESGAWGRNRTSDTRIFNPRKAFEFIEETREKCVDGARAPPFT
jgi:hypothetical protein